MEARKFRIAEIFGPVVQGEGPFVGRPCYFIRFGGCDDRCTWCDSMHAVKPELVKLLPFMTTSEIIAELKALPGDFKTVILSGGNPAIWNLEDLVLDLRNNYGFDIHVETQGTILPDWFKYVNEIIFSPKPPSAGPALAQPKVVNNIRYFTGVNDYLKIVIFDKVDYLWALHFADAVAMPLYLSCGTLATDTTEDLLKRYRQLISWTQEIHDPVVTIQSVLPQLHVVTYGHKLKV